MKVKLTFGIDRVEKTILAHLEQNNEYQEISYKEQPGVKVWVRCYNDKIEVIKSGNVNIHVTHKLHQKDEVPYQIKMGDQEFMGNVKIRTTHLQIEKQNIRVEYTRDNDRVIQTWRYE